MVEFYPIKGYEQEYEWSPTLEAVRGLKSGKILKWKYDNQGRPFITLCKNGVTRTFFKAMLIYSHAHQCEIPRGYQVHHIDFDWTNNDPNNLQLLTKEAHLKLHAKTRECFQKNNYRSKAVVAIDENGNIVHRFPSTWEAGRNGFCQSPVSAACRGCFHREGNHFYKGYYWYYEQEWLRLR